MNVHVARLSAAVGVSSVRELLGNAGWPMTRVSFNLAKHSLSIIQIHSWKEKLSRTGKPNKWWNTCAYVVRTRPSVGDTLASLLGLSGMEKYLADTEGRLLLKGMQVFLLL